MLDLLLLSLGMQLPTIFFYLVNIHKYVLTHNNMKLKNIDC